MLLPLLLLVAAHRPDGAAIPHVGRPPAVGAVTRGHGPDERAQMLEGRRQAVGNLLCAMGLALSVCGAASGLPVLTRRRAPSERFYLHEAAPLVLGLGVQPLAGLLVASGILVL